MTTSPSLPVAFFDRISGIYDTEFVQSLVYRPTQDAVLAELRTLHPSQVLDIGCGTGQLTANSKRSSAPIRSSDVTLHPECSIKQRVGQMRSPGSKARLSPFRCLTERLTPWSQLKPSTGSTSLQPSRSFTEFWLRVVMSSLR